LSGAAEPWGALRLMGILNVTPDSFSDGGGFAEQDAAIAHGRALIEQGAHIVDVGGESTRPGSQPVEEAEELRRVVGVVAALAGAGAQISIDTRKAAVARAALDAGATLVNDVSALADPGMAPLVAAAGVDVCLVHMRGEPATMQSAEGPEGPHYEDVVAEVKAFLAERIDLALNAGVARERILIDPGIGFGKTEQHNLELLRRLEELRELDAPIVIGTSRKGFLGRIAARAAGREQGVAAQQRLPGTIASNVLAYERGASVFRVHDVAAVRDGLAVAAATLGGRWTARGAGTTPAS
jgi:dihydropteroate synthase